MEATAAGMSLAISSNCAQGRAPKCENDQPITTTTTTVAITTAKIGGNLAYVVSGLAKPVSQTAITIEANITSKTSDNSHSKIAASSATLAGGIHCGYGEEL